MDGKNDNKSKYKFEIGKLIWVSFAFATFAWFFDSISDSLIFHKGTLSEQIFTPTSHELWTRLLFAFILVISIAYSQLNATKRIRSEEALRQSDEKYRMLVDNIHEGVFIIQDAKLQFVNEAFAITAGYTAEEVIGREFREFVAPEDMEMVADRYYRRQAGENVPSEYEFRMLRRDGTKTLINMNVGLTTYRGRVASMGILKDITERKRAEEKLKLFSEAVENAVDGIQIVSLDGHILYSNRAVEKIYGFSHEDYKGKHVNEMNADPEFAGRVILPSIMETGQWTGELMVRHKDGGVFPIWLTASVVKNKRGEPIATVGIIKDITERKRIEQVLLESEERYHNLFENSPISLWEEDCSDLKKYIDALKSKGIKNLQAYFDKHPKDVALCANMVKVVDVNNATINLFKAKNKGDFITGLENIFTENSYEVFKEELIAIAEGKTSFESEDTVKTLTGDKIHINVRWVLTPGSEKAYSKRLVSIVDITERKRAEEAIKNYAKRLEESNRIKELFTDIMHHDLLNPLNISKGYIEILCDGETSPQKINCLEIIERNLTKGMGLIESATMLSKLESLENISFDDLDLKEVIEKVIENLGSLVDRSGMKLENNVTINMPVRANRIIEEVFINLITNAVKYASNGKKIIVECEDAKERWRVKVLDFGEGINDSDKTVIFERFQRGGKKGIKGSGLGLAIARKIIELHSGRIWVEDNPEGGAVFVVEIPKDPVFKYGV